MSEDILINELEMMDDDEIMALLAEAPNLRRYISAKYKAGKADAAVSKLKEVAREEYAKVFNRAKRTKGKLFEARLQRTPGTYEYSQEAVDKEVELETIRKELKTIREQEVKNGTATYTPGDSTKLVISVDEKEMDNYLMKQQQQKGGSSGGE